MCPSQEDSWWSTWWCSRVYCAKDPGARVFPGLFLQSEEKVSTLTPSWGLSPWLSTDFQVSGYLNQFLGDSQCCLFFFLMSGNLICFIMQSSYMFNWCSKIVDFFLNFPVFFYFHLFLSYLYLFIFFYSFLILTSQNLLVISSGSCFPYFLVST